MFLVITLCILAGNVFSQGRKLPYFQCNGTHYQCYYEMGKQFKEEINMSWESSGPALLKWYSVYLEVYDGFQTKVKTKYPDIYDELRGYADGCDLPFHYIFLLNLIEDLYCQWDEEVEKMEKMKDFGRQHPVLGIYKFNEEPGLYMKECSDIHLSTVDRHIIGHNEDTGPLIRNISFLADMNLHSENGEERDHFVSYIYPGWLPGIAFAYNRHGLTFSNNGVYPVHCYVDIPKTIINRLAYSASSFSDLLLKTQINGYPRSYGTSMNIGNIWSEIDGKKQYLLESAPKKFSVFEIDERVGNYSHFNDYRLLNIDFKHVPSSTTRLQKMDSLPPVRTKKDVLDRLGTNPIYNPSTVASALFDLDERMVHIYDENPSTSHPVNSYSLVLE